MANDFSSTQNTGNLVELIEKIPNMGVPEKMTQQYMGLLGYKSKNDRSIINVFKSLKIIDNQGVPTDNWNKLRSKSRRKAVLGFLVREAYSDLFKIYPNAEAQSFETLFDFFASKTNVGEATLKNIIGTFMNLCKISDFEKIAATESNQTIPSGQNIDKKANNKHGMNLNPSMSTNLGSSQIHFNIQVHIPGEQTPEVYENIFRSLGKYVLGVNQANNE